MCAISGSSNLKKAYELYELGLDRGSQSSGFLGITRNNFLVLKQKEVFKIETIEKEMEYLEEYPVYCLFHSRAPTNTTEQEFNYNTTHPLSFKQWFVAQNGIIQNINDLKVSNTPKTITTDTGIISYDLYNFNGDICKTYERYKGLLTSWIFNSLDSHIYLVKAGSSLHIEEDSFSSVSFKNSTSVDKDGIVFKFNGMGFEEIQTFNYDNPYFLI